MTAQVSKRDIGGSVRRRAQRIYQEEHGGGDYWICDKLQFDCLLLTYDVQDATLVIDRNPDRVLLFGKPVVVTELTHGLRLVK